MEENEWWTQFYLNGYSIDVLALNSPDKYLIRLFQSASANIITKPIIETLQLASVDYPSTYHETTDRISLSSLAYQLKDRLEILGYSYIDAENSFLAAKEVVINRLILSDNKDQIYTSYPDQAAFESDQIELEYLQKVDFSDFLNSSKDIINNKLRRVIDGNGMFRRSIIPKDISNLLTRHLVCHGFGVFHFPNKLHLIRSLVEVINDDSLISYEFEGINTSVDIDSLVKYYNELYDPMEINAKYGLKTLIATEGKTDTEFIKKSLFKLYPHLYDLYYFLDFHLKEGSSQSLIQVVKSLSSSGIPNNIIAIFDNDVEGINAIEKMSHEVFPSNVRVFRYPNIDLANNYPVSSWDNNVPSFENVNGKGCSIEMYLGKDSLTDENGRFYPLSKRDNRGQLNFGRFKDRIQENFRTKLQQTIQEEEYWKEMKSIIEMILNGFK